MKIKVFLAITLVALLFASLTAGTYEQYGLEPVAIVVDDHSHETFERTRDILGALGARGLCLFPPDAIIGYVPIDFTQADMSGLAVDVIRTADKLSGKFLGQVEEEKIARISERLKDIARGASPFDILLEGMGAFPKWDYVKVIWVGLGEGSDKVKDLAKKTEEIMSEEGFEKETREFSPHLTLGRVRSAKKKKQLKEMSDSVKVDPASSHISRIVLFKSELSPQGARYTELAAVELAG